MRCPEQLPGSLRRLYLFEPFDDSQLSEIRPTIKPIDLASGCWLHRQGDRAERFYLVQKGKIALFRQSLDGRESIVAIVAEDELFAEELIAQEEASYDLHARAIGETKLLSFDRRTVHRIVRHSTALCRLLLQTQHRRQQMLLAHIERLTLLDATQRILAYFLDQVDLSAEPRHVSLSVPKSTLASHLSIQPETLSRGLARLREFSYLREEGSALVLEVPTHLLADLACSHCPFRVWGCPGSARGSNRDLTRD